MSCKGIWRITSGSFVVVPEVTSLNSLKCRLGQINRFWPNEHSHTAAIDSAVVCPNCESKVLVSNRPQFETPRKSQVELVSLKRFENSKVSGKLPTPLGQRANQNLLVGDLFHTPIARTILSRSLNR